MAKHDRGNRQHLHNKIGNVVGERKHELYSRLKSGADVEKEIDAFIADISNELQSVVPSESFPDAIDSPSRERNDLADAVGEILTNDLAPPRLRDAVVNHVTDAASEDPQPNIDDDEDTDPPMVGKRYLAALETLGLDMPTIDRIADSYRDTGDDDHLVLTIGLLQRLLTLETGKGQPETLDNYLPRLINRLFRATYQCEEMAGQFAEMAAEARLPLATESEKGGDE